MGLGVSMFSEVFGRVGHYEQYAYNVSSKREGWEVRRYAGVVAVQTVGLVPDKCFMSLAKYIGVFSTPENTSKKGAPEAIAMTTPVVSRPEKIAMTTPVVTSKSGKSQSSMQFVLPSQYQLVEQVPVPTNPNLQLVQLPPRDMAVIQFSGYCDDDSAVSKYNELVGMMVGSGVEAIGDWELHRFNPPYTLGPFRHNEVCIPVRVHDEAVMGC